MKTLIAIFSTLTLLSTYTMADEGEINPDTARAYEGYLVTFQWPDGQSTEQVDYKNILSTENLLRLSTTEELTTKPENNIDPSTPFGNIEARLGTHVKVLANQEWTLIFKFPGDTIKKSFYSTQEKDGYPELTGDIAIKLGRYLESDIEYKHYLFDSFTQPETANTNSAPENIFSRPTLEPENQPEIKQFEPALVLKLNLKNKTASKKINYLDHPIIGTLLYFEPIELDDALEKIAAQSVTPETGSSLNYDELQSTNELSGQ
ncbi:hypothetical protein C0J08_08230 [Marinomonas sp. CT5]|nr:hypothetical protein C0J08_08230 [Marinomonas sp. CT5]